MVTDSTPIQNLSIFRMEANLLRAQTGQTGIEMAEALRYLKACHFNSTKALEIYKNYQVSPSHLQEWLLSGFCCSFKLCLWISPFKGIGEGTIL